MERLHYDGGILGKPRATRRMAPLGDGYLLRSLLSGLARVGNRQDAILHRRLDLLGLKGRGQPINRRGGAYGRSNSTHLDALGDRHRAREAAKATLAQEVSVLVAVGLELRLPRDSKEAVVHVNADVLLVYAGELERRGHEVLLLVLVNVDPDFESVMKKVSARSAS